MQHKARSKLTSKSLHSDLQYESNGQGFDDECAGKKLWEVFPVGWKWEGKLPWKATVCGVCVCTRVDVRKTGVWSSNSEKHALCVTYQSTSGKKQQIIQKLEQGGTLQNFQNHSNLPLAYPYHTNVFQNNGNSLQQTLPIKRRLGSLRKETCVLFL